MCIADRAWVIPIRIPCNRKACGTSGSIILLLQHQYTIQSCCMLIYSWIQLICDTDVREDIDIDMSMSMNMTLPCLTDINVEHRVFVQFFSMRGNPADLTLYTNVCMQLHTMLHYSSQ